MLKLAVLIALLVALSSIFIDGQMINYKPACNLKDTAYAKNSSAPKLRSKNGFEIFIQAPVYALINQNILNNLPLKLQYPINETFFIRYLEDKPQGSLYIAGKHKMLQLLFNKKNNESILVDYQYASCDVEPMVEEPGYDYGYFHGSNSPIHVPFVEELADVTNFNSKYIGRLPYPYRGFHDVEAYETCINVKAMLVRVLSTIDSLPIPAELLQAIPDIPVKATWYWADKDWEMEDGSYDETGPVPLGIDFTGAVSVKLLRNYFELSVNTSMTFANYHSHYPPHDVHQDLLQVPAGIYCPNRIFGNDDPKVLPDFPPKFSIRTETLYYGDQHNYVYNTEDYYDYTNKKFRFDISMNRPDKNGPVVWELLHDYTNDVAYKIDRQEQTCEMKKISDMQNGRFDDSPITHMLMRPYDLLQLNQANPVYIGKKPCRGMACHYWSGRKDLQMKINGSDTYGIFGIWATTDKWSQNFSSSNTIMDNYIVKIDVQIFDKKTKQFVGRENIHIFNYRAITSDSDVFFMAPSAAFCSSETDPERPHLPSRYQYQGEYSEHQHNSSTSIFLNYDAAWNVVRFDWTPVNIPNPSFRESRVYDLRSSVVYKVNRVTMACAAAQISPTYQGEDVDPLAFIWPPTVHSLIAQNQLRYIGVRPCRRMTCDSFEASMAENNKEKITYDVEFLTDEFPEESSEFPEIKFTKALARIVHNHWNGDDMVEPTRAKSVDIYDFSDMRSVYWEYDVAAACFADVPSQWIRLYFTPDSPDAMKYVTYSVFRTNMMEQIRKNASDITPIRIGDLRASAVGDDLRVVTEFVLRDHHPQERYFGPSLDDATQSLQSAVISGQFKVQIVIPQPEGRSLVFYFTAEQSFEVCEKGPCSAANLATPIIQLDVGALVGTIIGSVIAGFIVVAVILSIVISRKHNVPMKSLYVGDSVQSVANSGMANELISQTDSKGDE